MATVNGTLLSDDSQVSVSVNYSTWQPSVSYTFTVGTTYNFFVQCKRGYTFGAGSVVTLNGEAFPEITTSYAAWDNYTVTEEGVTIVVTPTPQRYEFNFSAINITNASANVDTTTTYDGSPLHIVITANEGYFFSSPPTLSYKDNGGTLHTFEFATDEAGEYPATWYYEYTNPNNSNDITLSGDAQVIPQDDIYGVITVYNPSNAQLKAIAEARYYDTTTTESDSTPETLDLGDFIASIKRLFINIPQGETAIVSLGGYSTGVESNVITTDTLETSLGSVTITGTYGNTMDYENTEIEIYLPFIGFQTLEPSKVMGKTLALNYKTNVVNGDSLAVITDAETNLVLYTFSCNVGFDIPYRVNTYDIQGTLSINASYLYDFTPFIIKRYNQSIDSSSSVNETDLETTLANMSGFVKCSEVFNTVNATKDEKAEITRLLLSGVIC